MLTPPNDYDDNNDFSPWEALVWLAFIIIACIYGILIKP